jgi:L-alanine-DL-glutamate epimerase-like enolase superfamily enzyme
MVLVEASAGDQTGYGWSYTDPAAAALVRDQLAGLVEGKDALAVPRLWQTMVHEVRNLGQPGIAACAISAVDNALWDLKARLLGLPLVSLLGACTPEVPVYWSAGFTSYSKRQLWREFAERRAQGFRRFKMKVGRDPGRDPERVRVARRAIGSDAELYTDANGGYTRKQALALAEVFRESGVSWLEEPVPADDFEGLRLIRDRAPAGMAVASGEYGYELVYFQRLLTRGCVDVLQIDVSRCGGISAFLRAAALAQAWLLPISSHTAPSQHLHVCAALPNVQHIEYFKDHAIVEHALFDGAPRPVGGVLRPDLTRPGTGLTLKRADAARFAA